MNPSRIAAVLVTRGGYDISEVEESLSGFGELTVWDNSKMEKFAVYGRFAGAMRSTADVVYVQDDDCIVDSEAVCASYEPGAVVCNWNARHREINEPLYRGGIAPVGWGAVFDRRLLDVFDDYLAAWPFDELFRRECDRVFTALNLVKLIDVPVRNLPRAESGMWREKRHLGDFEAIRGRISQVRKLAA